MTVRARAALVAVLAAATATAGASAAAPRGTTAGFDSPVLLTTTPGYGGFEPSLAVDAHDNVWATAHRADGVVTPDERAAAGARAGSWLWFSADGRTFRNARTSSPVDTHEAGFGLEGDVVTDAHGNVHFVDVAPPKVSYSRWRTTGRDRVTATSTSVALPYPALDRPFLSANGRTVLLAVNDVLGNPLSPTRADVAAGHHQGQYSFYVSTDGGATFRLNGYHPGDTVFCRPHVSRRDERTLVAVCHSSVLEGFDDDTPVEQYTALVSHDTGATWTKVVLVPDSGASESNLVEVFPSIAETPDGTLHALVHMMVTTGTSADVALVRSRPFVTSSRDGGRTWSPARDVGLEPGLWQHTSIAADRSGRLGVAGYHRPDLGAPWRFRAAVFRPGARRVSSVEVAPGSIAYPANEVKPQGEFTQAAFDSHGRLNVVYGVREASASGGDGKRLASSKVWFARQR